MSHPACQRHGVRGIVERVTAAAGPGRGQSRPGRAATRRSPGSCRPLVRTRTRSRRDRGLVGLRHGSARPGLTNVEPAVIGGPEKPAERTDLPVPSPRGETRRSPTRPPPSQASPLRRPRPEDPAAEPAPPRRGARHPAIGAGGLAKPAAGGGPGGDHPPVPSSRTPLRPRRPRAAPGVRPGALLRGGGRSVLAGGSLDDHPVQPLLERVAVGLLLGQDGGQLAGALGVADGLERLDPGRRPSGSRSPWRPGRGRRAGAAWTRSR